MRKPQNETAPEPNNSRPPGVARAEFGRIARDTQARLLRAARRMAMGDDDRAADLVQNALVRGYEAFLQGRFTPGSNAYAWLLRIMTNDYINSYRHSKKWDAGIDVDTLTRGGEIAPPSAHAASEDRPDTALLSGIMDEELERALASLSEPLRMCVMLVDVEGLDYAEAAAALEIPIGTVRSRLSRARMMLHAQLVDYARSRRRL
ncbi:MAG: sigma-70 family RNA polymerase sigma factor [Capsulimonas sp.]|uniref:sigma-70 family RNA polymerase sigma factor n=1 Tax=Capsulimonas sp. TaxID=2494211 RepID=UPI003267C15F